jgi:hypothetical protein
VHRVAEFRGDGLAVGNPLVPGRPGVRALASPKVPYAIVLRRSSRSHPGVSSGTAFRAARRSTWVPAIAGPRPHASGRAVTSSSVVSGSLPQMQSQRTMRKLVVTALLWGPANRGRPRSR